MQYLPPILKKIPEVKAPSRFEPLLSSSPHSASYVHFPILGTPLTKDIVFSYGLSFEMQLLFGNCGCLSSFSSWFKRLRVFENENPR